MVPRRCRRDNGRYGLNLPRWLRNKPPHAEEAFDGASILQSSECVVALASQALLGNIEYQLDDLERGIELMDSMPELTHHDLESYDRARIIQLHEICATATGYVASWTPVEGVVAGLHDRLARDAERLSEALN